MSITQYFFSFPPVILFFLRIFLNLCVIHTPLKVLHRSEEIPGYARRITKVIQTANNVFKSAGLPYPFILPSTSAKSSEFTMIFAIIMPIHNTLLLNDSLVYLAIMGQQYNASPSVQINKNPYPACTAPRIFYAAIYCTTWASCSIPASRAIVAHTCLRSRQIP